MAGQDRSNSEANESSFSQLPTYPGNPFVISEIICQECEEVRPGTKCYPVLHVVCLLFGFYSRIDHVVKCPACMRRFIVRRILPSLLLANLGSPLVLIWWVVLFIRTFTRLDDDLATRGPKT